MRFGIQMMAADAGMDTTCPSPEIPNDSRKRPLDGDSDNGSTKRSHFSGEWETKQTEKKQKQRKNVLLMCWERNQSVDWIDPDVALSVRRARESNTRRLKKKDEESI